MTAPYEHFLGRWVLIPDSCQYEHGDAPAIGEYEITEDAGVLAFDIRWTDRAGEQHAFSFSGTPDGKRHAFSGGELADEMLLACPSPRELTSRAYYKGKELMIAQRQLDDRLVAMRITQVVLLPDGSRPTNISVYRRHANN